MLIFENSCNSVGWNVYYNAGFHSVRFILLGPTEISDNANINTSVNGVAPSDAEPRPEGKVTDVQLSHVGEQNEVHSKFICIWQVLLKVSVGVNI